MALESPSVSSVFLQRLIFSDPYRRSWPWSLPVSLECLFNVFSMSPHCLPGGSFSVTPLEDRGHGVSRRFQLGAIWGHLGAILDDFRAILGDSGTILGPFLPLSIVMTEELPRHFVHKD